MLRQPVPLYFGKYVKNKGFETFIRKRFTNQTILVKLNAEKPTKHTIHSYGGICMGLFDKKYCSVCGDKIGLLGNRKLDDGNLCKNCASKLSPLFSERRHSTVEQIKEQLAYREENREKLRSFVTTRSYGSGYKKLLIDDNAKVFVVTSARNLVDANPDIVEFSMVTGCDTDIDEYKHEEKKKDAEGKEVSYNPPRYEFSYNFDVIIRVNHPYFDEMRVNLSDGRVETGHHSAAVGNNPEYDRYKEMGEEVRGILLGIRQEKLDQVLGEGAPKQKMICPYCAASVVPDGKGRCEFCGMTIAEV